MKQASRFYSMGKSEVELFVGSSVCKVTLCGFCVLYILIQ